MPEHDRTVSYSEVSRVPGQRLELTSRQRAVSVRPGYNGAYIIYIETERDAVEQTTGEAAITEEVRP